MPGNSNVLALFAPQPPIEPTAAKVDRGSDNDSNFKDFLSDAKQQVDKAQNTNPGDSAKNQSETKMGQAEKSKPKIKNNNDKPETETQSYEDTAATVQNEPATETVTKDSLLEENAVLAAQLNELGIEQAQFEALLASLGLDGEIDIESLLQSLTQNLSLEKGLTNEQGKGALTQADLLAKLQQYEGEAIDLLKKSGLTDEQAKNLINHLKSTPATSAQKEVDKTLDLNLKKDLQAQQVASAEKETLKSVEGSESSKDTRKQGQEGKTDVYTPVKETSNKAERSDRAALDKIPETPKTDEAPRITQPEGLADKGTKTSNLSQLLNDNNAQATLVQTDGGKDAGNFKGLETAKAAPDLQVQTPTATADNAIKAVESSKSILPEKLIARGATETKVVDQIINKLNVRINGAKNEVHVKLDPPSLGTVRMNITTSGDSVRTVIIAENHAVKQIIENNFNQLRDAMGEQGLKVDSFTVTVGGESGNSNQNGKQLGEKGDSPNTKNTASAGIEEGFEESDSPFFFDGNQSISVLA